MTSLWSTMDDQRAAVADLLESLTPDEWGRPSLCAEWTVRDVAAHLTMQQLSVRDMIVRTPIILRAKGDMNRAIRDMTTAQVHTHTDAELIALIRASIGSRKHTVGVTRYETLTDILVHTQDIALPLGRTIATPPEAAAAAATRMMTMHWPRPFPIKKRLRGYDLIATDTTWRTGTGPRIEGPMGTLLLLVCGRPIALDHLTGDGVQPLRAALQ
ncbi:maleylpyruvate isomerase family mycothiol-dependent enzyme [Dactylosporangium sp. NPDC051541]|uniref:maleylpyruvate isomerase family mycothiol-dependent enzyme n=1 Tax=Dactylosporangium sp. NPDC051541 TaxID=3363977 RepID=UPI003788F64C